MTLEERYALSCYETLVQLQEGKEIYLVRNTDTQELYVKKILDIYNQSVYQRMKELDIPNIPKIFLLVEENGKLIVTEEFIHGDSLEKLLSNYGPMTEEQVIKIMRDLCDILECLHTCTPPVIHRDIKPSNIMISKDGVVKLIDFNAAKEYSSDKKEDTTLIGTQDFAAPEQYGFGQSTPQTDIYAMGITMNYLLTGKYPKDELWNGSLKKVIEKCIAINPKDRFADVNKLKKSLNIDSNQQKQLQNQQQKQKSIFTRNLYARKDFLPVGFRTGGLWKMILAVYGYLFILGVVLATPFQNTDGTSQTGFMLWSSKITELLMMLGVVFIMGNYGGICYQLPFMKKGKVLHYFLRVIYCVIYILLLLFLMAFIQVLVSPS